MQRYEAASVRRYHLARVSTPLLFVWQSLLNLRCMMVWDECD
jgi:hypothetical protein